MYGPGLIECIFVSAFHTRTTKSILLTFAMQSSQHKLKKKIHNGPKLGTSSLAHNYIVLYNIVQESHLSLFQGNILCGVHLKEIKPEIFSWCTCVRVFNMSFVSAQL